MNRKELADRVRALRKDETLMYVLSGIQDDATKTFQNPHSDEEKVLESYQAIKAIGYLETAFDAIEADAKIDRES